MSDERDRTNSGTVFAPGQNTSLVLSGVVNVGGVDRRVAILKHPIKKDGKAELVVYEKVGVLFTNDRKDKDTSPDFSGPIDYPKGWRLSAWRKHSEKAGHFLSIAASPPLEQQQREEAPPQQPPADPRYGTQHLDDDIPF